MCWNEKNWKRRDLLSPRDVSEHHWTLVKFAGLMLIHILPTGSQHSQVVDNQSWSG
jgi:hypothetical protein